MEPVLTLQGIDVFYGDTQVLFDASLSLKKNRTLGLVGESGSGKSTIARVAAGLLNPAKGKVCLDGQVLSGRRKKEDCKKVQMVFQNPEGSLNPKYKIGSILSQAMLFHGTASRGNVREKCRELVERMQLPEDTLERYPGSFSGGQKQRIALARALCVEPEVLIADEPTSALDVSVQLQVLELIKGLRREMDLTILFISHDLGVIHYICDEVAVMRRGRILELESTEKFFESPRTAYGKELLDAVPKI